MQVGRFEKVSLEQFKKAMRDVCAPPVTDDQIAGMYESIQIPTRATSGSAGYDFSVPFSLDLFPGESIKIPTGIRAKINDGWFLCCAPRSGLGFKYRLQLDNTIGIIDSDYYYSENGGHIFAKITNDSKEDRTISLKQGDRFMQAIFIPFGVTYDDRSTDARNGGMGSTGF